MFFLFDSLLANKGAWIWHKKNNQKKYKSVISLILQEIFLQNRFYPDVEFYGWKNNRKNMFLTDKIVRKAFVWAGYFIL